VVLWFCGFVVLWFCGFVVLWFCGFVVLWFCGFVVLWFGDLVVLWFGGLENVAEFSVGDVVGVGSGFRSFPLLFPTFREGV